MRAVILAAKEETLAPVFPLAAAFPRLAENSHPGHQLPTALLHPPFTLANSNTASGLNVFFYDEGVGPRCTGKERDTETGLDYFGARYFSSPQGRFSSADPKMFPQDISDSQGWNNYGYTRDNPLRYIDPDGEDFKDYIVGIVNAVGSNSLGGRGRGRIENSDFKLGQALAGC